MATPKPLAGINAKVRINGDANVLVAGEWKVTPKVNKMDVTSFETGGFVDWIPTFSETQIDIKGYWDGANNMHDGIGGQPIVHGAFLTNVKLYIYGIGSPFFLFPKVFVESCPVSAAVKDKVAYELMLQTKGLWFYPTGVVT